jgi:hypothetical protein
MSALLERQRAIREADAALRQADLPMYADVVVSLNKIIDAVEGFLSKHPAQDDPARRLSYQAEQAKDLIACFQQNPVTYARLKQEAQDMTDQLLASIRLNTSGDNFF